MRTWTATTTTAARPEAVLDVLTDPEASGRGLSLAASGPVGFEVDYRLAPVAGGSEVHASVSVRPAGGIVGRLLAEATSALLSAGALEAALSRVSREAVAC